MCMRLVRRAKDDQSGITGLETAIILIAFVMVASVLAYVVLTAGLFSSQKAKEAVHAGLEEVESTMELKGSVFLAEFDLEALMPHVDLTRSFREIAQYPAVARDLALLVGRDVPAGEIEATLRAAGGEILESLHLFDVYEGKRIAAGKRSLAYSLIFRARDRTLTDDEVNTVQDRLLAAVAEKHGAQLRSA